MLKAEGGYFRKGAPHVIQPGTAIAWRRTAPEDVAHHVNGVADGDLAVAVDVAITQGIWIRRRTTPEDVTDDIDAVADV